MAFKRVIIRRVGPLFWLLELMSASSKIILNSVNGLRPGLDSLVQQWILGGVKYVGVVGVDASRISDLIGELCAGDGENTHFILRASHDNDETLEDAIFFAESLSEEYSGTINVVEF